MAVDLLVPVAVGGVVVAAPVDVPRHVPGRAGDLWEWTGDGEDLLTLVVATRRSSVPDAHGVAGHLTREVRQVEADLADPRREAVDRPVFGDAVAEATVVVGTATVGEDLGGLDGDVAVRHALAVATDAHAHLHLVHLVTRDEDAGRALEHRILDSLALDREEHP